MAIKVLSARYGEMPAKLHDHFHDCHQLIYIVDGEADITVDGEHYRASSGHLVVFSRFERHSIHVRSAIYKRYALELETDASDGASDDYLLSSVLVNRAEGFCHVIDMCESSRESERLLGLMVREYAEKPPMYDEMLRAALRAILITVYRTAPELYSADRSRIGGIVQEIQTRFEREYHEKFSLPALAAEYHISTSHLSHLFKKITGYAPMEHLKACRISASKRYLVHSAMTVKEIVYRCGFSDESNFCRIFHRDTGMTPTAFRKKYRSTL